MSNFGAELKVTSSNGYLEIDDQYYFYTTSGICGGNKDNLSLTLIKLEKILTTQYLTSSRQLKETEDHVLYQDSWETTEACHQHSKDKGCCIL